MPSVKFDWKLFLWSLIVIAVPVVVAQLMPDWPQESTIEVILYIIAGLIGVTPTVMVYRYRKAKKEAA